MGRKASFSWKPRNRKKSTNQLQITDDLLVINTVRTTSSPAGNMRIEFSLPNRLVSCFVKNSRAAFIKTFFFGFTVSAGNSYKIKKKNSRTIQIILFLSIGYRPRGTFSLRAYFYKKSYLTGNGSMIQRRTSSISFSSQFYRAKITDGLLRFHDSNRRQIWLLRKVICRQSKQTLRYFYQSAQR